jgi:hypothetical protein
MRIQRLDGAEEEEEEGRHNLLDRRPKLASGKERKGKQYQRTTLKRQK